MAVKEKGKRSSFCAGGAGRSTRATDQRGQAGGAPPGGACGPGHFAELETAATATWSQLSLIRWFRSTQKDGRARICSGS